MLNKKLLGLVSGTVPMIIKKVVLTWLSLVCNIVLWFAFAELIERSLIDGAADWGYAAKTLCVIAVCIVLRFVLTRIIPECTADIADRVKAELRDKLYSKLTRLGSGYKGVYSTAQLIQLATEGVEQIEIYFTQYLPQLIYSLIAPLTLFTLFVGYSPKTAVSLLVCVPLIPLSIVAVQKVAKRLLSKYWDAYTDLGDGFLENLQGLTTLKVYGADGRKHEEMNAEAERFRKITMKVLTMQLNSVTVMDVVAYGGAALGIIMCYLDFAGGAMSLGQAVATVFLASEFFIPMRLLGSYFHIAMNGVAAADKLDRLLNAQEQKRGTKGIQRGAIRTEGLHFGYTADREILKGIELEIKEGSVVGICGKSGCGKSTLAAIISGRSTGYTGKVYCANDEYADISYESMAKEILYVGCSDYIFSSTIGECLREADASASEEKMRSVLDRVSLLEFADANKGLDTEIAQNGTNLSGGQKQRLALARALLRKSSVYIFDEVTSNTDAESERIILDAIYALAKTATVIIISHKLSNIKRADRIYFMDKGVISEEGTHEELMRMGGSYSEIYKVQASYESYAGLEEV